MSSVSVHDNEVYALAADYDQGRVVLYTFYPDTEPPEYTDVVFEGVVAQHFEQVGHRPAVVNILFDVEEADPLHVLREFEDLLARAKNYGWPLRTYDSLEDLAARLTAGGAKCFRVNGVGGCGLDGFVFAASMRFRTRPSRAEIIA